MAYLGTLECGALPELAHLARIARKHGDGETSRAATSTVRERVAEERRRLQAWTAWTWRRADSVQRAEETIELDPRGLLRPRRGG